LVVVCFRWYRAPCHLVPTTSSCLSIWLICSMARWASARLELTVGVATALPAPLSHEQPVNGFPKRQLTTLLVAVLALVGIFVLAGSTGPFKFSTLAMEED